MKKLLVLCLFTLSYSLCDANPTAVNLAPVTDLPPEWTHGHDKAPARIPLFYIEENTLSFNPYDDNFVIELWDGETLFYSQTVLAGTNQVELPTSLEGEYSLLIKFENKAYIGNVEL